MQDAAELKNDDELQRHAGSDVGFGQEEVADKNSVAHDNYSLDFSFPKRGMTAHVGTPDGRDRLPEEVVVCPNTKTADANAKIVDKTLMMIFFGFLVPKLF